MRMMSLINQNEDKLIEMVFFRDSQNYFKALVPEKVVQSHRSDGTGALFGGELELPSEFRKPELWLRYIIPSAVFVYGVDKTDANPYHFDTWGLS